jgi:hypothetical protein
MAKSLLDNKNVRTPSEDYLSYLIELSEQERKDVYQEVMKDRTDRLSDRLENQTLGQILGGGINLSERIISGLSGSGFDKIPVFKGTSEEKAFIKAAKDILDNREIKSEGGLLGDQRKIDANKDGEITAKDFEMLREQRQSGGLLDDDMMRVGYADGENVLGKLAADLLAREPNNEARKEQLRKFAEQTKNRLTNNKTGPQQRMIDFGMRDDYVNREILTGIVSESKIIGKYKDKEKYSNPEKLEAHLNKYIDGVEKNTQYAGTLNRGAMMDEFMKELKLYGVGREQMAEGGKTDAPQMTRKIYTNPKEIKEYADYYDISEQDVLVRHNQWNIGQWQNVFQKIGFDVDNDYELNILQDFAQGKKSDKKLVNKLLNKYNLPENSTKKIINNFVKEVRPDDKDRGLFENLNIGELMPRNNKAEGGEMDALLVIAQPKEEENEMLPDEIMEQNFIDFVVGEALSPEEESMLNEQLEANPELSILFDKVVEKASEFTGAGPVDGPGTGTSDDIPARLSDGEFVFTAKAVEQIGADNLMKMMKDAEAAYDAGSERKGYANGEEVIQDEDINRGIKKVEVEYSVQQQPTSTESLLGQPLYEEDETSKQNKELMRVNPTRHVYS